MDTLMTTPTAPCSTLPSRTAHDAMNALLTTRCEEVQATAQTVATLALSSVRDTTNKKSLSPIIIDLARREAVRLVSDELNLNFVSTSEKKALLPHLHTAGNELSNRIAMKAAMLCR